jgi:ribosomal protein S18 acetylase RimI-like enzyme
VPPRSVTTSPPEIRIRPARASDLDALVELENGVFSSDRISARQLRHHLGSPGARILVAMHGRDIVAAAVVFFRAGSGIARLYSIAVAERARGWGVGARLLAAAEASARRLGRTAIRLEVRTDNSAARALYERRGYRYFGLKKNYYEDGQDALRYEKALARRRGPAPARRR